MKLLIFNIKEIALFIMLQFLLFKFNYFIYFNFE